jgi:hypothetical protein
MKSQWKSITLSVIISVLLVYLLVWAQSLPQQYESARMTDSTLATSIDNEVGNAEKAHALILGIPLDTNISNAMFLATATGLTKVIFQDLAGDPAAAGEMARNATLMKFHDGSSVRVLVSRDLAETLTNKTLAAANNVIDADTAVALAANGGNCSAGNAPLGVDTAGAVEGCFDVSTQTELNTHMSDTTTHGTTGVVVGTSDTQTLTNKTLTTPVIASISNTGTLTLPISTDTLVGRATTDTLTNKTIDADNNTVSNIGSAEITDASVATTDLKTSTGSTASGTSINITMNDYSFFPNFDRDDCTGGGENSFTFGSLDTADDTVGRFAITFVCSTGTWDLRWRYITASRPHEIVILRDRNTGGIVTVWKSELSSSTRPPLANYAPHLESIELAKFPERLLALDAAAIHKEFARGTLQVAQVSRNTPAEHPWRLAARERGRVLIHGMPLAEVINGQ